MMTRIYILNLLLIAFLFSSCNNKVQKTDNSKKEPVRQTDSITPAIVSNIYFKATGTEPFWSVTISNSRITLKTLNDTIITPHANPNLAMDSNVKRYAIQTEMTELYIQISQTKCINAMSGTTLPYSVNLRFKKGKDIEFTELNGCGQYVTDYRLHDIWALETLNGENISEKDFGKELPLIEINSNTNTLIGTTGCNQMHGNLFFEYQKIRFTDIFTTEMMCLPDNQKEMAFLKALRSVTTYSITNRRLTLSNSNGNLLVFKKVD